MDKPLIGLVLPFLGGSQSSLGTGARDELRVDRYDFAAAGEAASKIKQVLRQLGMAPELVRRAAVAAYEAEMNLVIHSEGGQILLRVDTEKVTLVACDGGPGMPDVSLAMREATQQRRMR